MMMTNVFDDLFDDMMFGMPHSVRTVSSPMNCDVQEYPDHYELDMELAGFKKEDIQAELKDGYLTVKATRKTEHNKENQGRVIRSERFTGECRRTFYVGEQIRREDIKAAYEDGIPKLAIPKEVNHPEVAEDRRIMIA